ncbi:hypothetical protein LshimejAT787_0803530 [Lyophyllum shimeji]|uniref:Uncharacterized protein n=1 Tax=Lyophyllum shimeji TaxID=47721 RepID=A0A9P3UPN7_LYOSH|nr:hypothetical protein LshimejAT787_0803530 [Lyophyllum shimeji]
MADIVPEAYSGEHEPMSHKPAADDSDSSDSDSEDDPEPPHPSTSPIWHVAKRPAAINLTINDLATKYETPNFLLTFTDFVKKKIPRAPTPSKYDRFDVYKQVTITLPLNRYLSPIHINKDRIRTSPAQEAQGRRLAVSSRFDTALVIEDPLNYCPSSSLRGEYQHDFNVETNSHTLMP